MITFRRILCPVDTSPFSRRAVRYAVALGKWYDAEVTVLSVRPAALPPGLWLSGPSAVPLEAPTSHEEAVDAIREFARGASGADPSRVVVADGSIVPEIVRVARELPADLIVMGTHGHSGFERLLLGSVTERILRKASCPVLTIPRLAAGLPEPPEVVFKTILCGMDRSDASLRALDLSVSLAQQAGGRLALVHVVEDVLTEEPALAGHFNLPECLRAIEPEIRAGYEALVPASVREWCEVGVHITSGKPHRELLRMADDLGADLIVLGTYGWSTPFGSTTNHVLRAAVCPVLAVPPAEARR
jgi:nucleotide-binding universal stress UspA family protein